MDCGKGLGESTGETSANPRYHNMGGAKYPSIHSYDRNSFVDQAAAEGGVEDVVKRLDHDTRASTRFVGVVPVTHLTARLIRWKLLASD